MAVFTVIEKNDIENLLLNYKIGTIRSFEGILEGVENTNYKIQTSINKYVLTIFEKRIDKDKRAQTKKTSSSALGGI